VELTAREFDFLACLVAHTGQVLTRSLLLERVWGYNTEIESGAVKDYIGTLRAKLNAAAERDLWGARTWIAIDSRPATTASGHLLALSS
jgi:DNA-binding response OmpR family regulator